MDFSKAKIPSYGCLDKFKFRIVVRGDLQKNIRDGSQSHPNVNKIEARYKIRDRGRQRQSEWKGLLNLRKAWEIFFTRYLVRL